MWGKNVGKVDARIRVIFGLILVLLAPLQLMEIIQIPFFTSVGAVVAGSILMVEGLVNRCILYSLLGINRCPADIESNEQD
jgi:hypothetical protein